MLLDLLTVSQEAGIVVWYFNHFQNFPQFVVINTVKDLSIANEAEVDLKKKKFLCFFDPIDVDNLISGSTAFSKSSMYIWKFSVHLLWKFSVHLLLKPTLKDFEHHLAST